jgi:hypothetical protein
MIASQCQIGKSQSNQSRGDYSSNEPKMDGTASAILRIALCAREG